MFLRKLSIGTRAFSKKLEHVPDLKQFLKATSVTGEQEPTEMEDQTLLPEYL